METTTALDISWLELCVVAILLALPVGVVVLGRRLRRRFALLALPLLVVCCTVLAWLVVEMAHMRSWASKPNPALEPVPSGATLVGPPTVEFHQGEPVVSERYSLTTRRGEEIIERRHFSPPLWVVDRATRLIGPVAGVALTLLFIAVPRRRPKKAADPAPAA